MIAPPRPALAALEAGIAHVARHHRALPATAAATRGRLLELRVALNVVRELDTLLGHAVAETAALAGVVPIEGRSASAALAGLQRTLARQGGVKLAEADRVREGLLRAVANRRASGRYRLAASYPDAIGASYREAAMALTLMIGAGTICSDRARSVSPAALRTVGDDAPAAHR